MRKLVMGCAVAGLIALSPKSEARPPSQPGLLPELIRICRLEVGMASWYGAERQGKPTASGELFDKNKFTAAHRKLPFGTTIRVTNLKNLESTVVRINDRGPGFPGRVIDVSWATAKKLGFLDTGLARVAIDVVSYPPSYFRQLTSTQSPKVNN